MKKNLFRKLQANGWKHRISLLFLWNKISRLLELPMTPDDTRRKKILHFIPFKTHVQCLRNLSGYCSANSLFMWFHIYFVYFWLSASHTLPGIICVLNRKHQTQRYQKVRFCHWQKSRTDTGISCGLLALNLIKIFKAASTENLLPKDQVQVIIRQKRYQEDTKLHVCAAKSKIHSHIYMCT